MLNLKIIHASTRDGRQGIAVSNWLKEEAEKFTSFKTGFIDLKEENLPMMNEPEHPRLGKYKYQHTKNWSAKIAPADAFIFVTCEYNYGMPAPLKNAIDYLQREWVYKPVALVGYGGIAAGTRAIQQIKQVVTTLMMFPFDGMLLANFKNQLNEKGEFIPTERNISAMNNMFADLEKLGENMKLLR